MNKHFVRVLADVDCEWEGLNPVYRIYIDNELLTERTWIWTEEWLQEILQIEVEPGDYRLSWQLVAPHLAQLKVRNIRVDFGPGQIVNDNILRVSA